MSHTWEGEDEFAGTGAVIAFDGAGRITFASAAAERALGRRNLEGQRLYELMAPSAADVERARLHDVLMSAPAAVAVQRGPELRFELANDLYRQFIGGRDVTERTQRDIFPDDAPLSQILFGVLRTGIPFERREYLFRVNRNPLNYIKGLTTRREDFVEEAWFDLVCQPTRDLAGDVDGVISFAFEVTELVLGRRRIEALAAERQRAVDARDEFLSIASHELKSPLTALQLQMQSLLRGLERGIAGTLAPERLASRAEVLNRQMKRLRELIEKLLDVSRITGGRLALDLEEVDLGQLCAEVAARHKETLAAAGCTLALHLPRANQTLVGRWDRSRIDQTLTNLLTNAIKYGDGKPIDLTVQRISDGNAARARIEVSDHGIGISIADRARIFDRFERAVSSRNFAGMGLGLWIVRQIVDSLGGTITVESEPGIGSTFAVELPLAPSEAKETLG